MPVFHRIFAIAIISMALSPSYGFASRNAYRCNGCNPIQYEDAAVAPQEIGIRYVYDFINGNISKYQVSREPNGHGFSYYAEQLSINTAEQAYFDSAATAWNSNGSSLKSMAYVNVSPTFPGSSVVSPSASAYDIVRTSAMQNNITDWMQGAAITSPQSQFEQRIKDLINAIKQSPANIVFDESDTSQLTITFIFSNGHKVTFVMKKGSAVVMTDAVDGNNNHRQPGAEWAHVHFQRGRWARYEQVSHPHRDVGSHLRQYLQRLHYSLRDGFRGTNMPLRI
jgi:hypothetical protein